MNQGMPTTAILRPSRRECASPRGIATEQITLGLLCLAVWQIDGVQLGPFLSRDPARQRKGGEDRGPNQRLSSRVAATGVRPIMPRNERKKETPCPFLRQAPRLQQTHELGPLRRRSRNEPDPPAISEGSQATVRPFRESAARLARPFREWPARHATARLFREWAARHATARPFREWAAHLALNFPQRRWVL
jgi:hypothetical protein